MASSTFFVFSLEIIFLPLAESGRAAAAVAAAAAAAAASADSSTAKINDALI